MNALGPYAETVTAWCSQLARRYDTAPALVTDDEVVSFAELDDRAARRAAGLRALGVERGDAVAVFLPTSGTVVELFLATARLGAVTIGVNTRFRAEEVRHLLEVSAAKVLVATDRFLGVDGRGIVAEALATMAAPPAVVWPDELAALLTGPATGALGVADVSGAAQPGDLAVAFTTSGTTGRPKLAAHDHAGVVRHLGAAARAFAVAPGDTALVALPLCGTFGFVSALSAFAGGARVVLMDHFDAGPAAALVARHGVTHLSGSDDMLLGVISAARAASHDLGSWREGAYAEFTSQGRRVVDAADAVGARLSGVYGSSETFALLARWPGSHPAEQRAGNGGTLVDEAMEVRAADPASGELLAVGEPGELQFRGPSVLQAYVADAGTFTGAFTPDGWFRSGDLGTVHDEGRSFTYLARMGDALRLSGFLTDPAEIEQRLVAHHGVRAAQVVGVARPGRGAAAVAFVIAEGDRHPTEDELVAHCAAGLANYKVPRRIVTVDAFPTVEGANGVKIRKAELRRRALELLEG